jgi:hypothetical protein
MITRIWSTSLSKSKSYLTLLKALGQMLFRADIGIDNLPKIVIAAPVTF